ncbi:hypothetical protein DPMN_143161 [Dreissena polymorpha]|uniref:Uncharacterized protein n=1 Tax=Dreissena polymorpha TaxID=45954 RepID=A0A9D4JJF1_DREPO|nr:hypothetical protein DPMN_143161 [Dreissena polymorpha]
MIGKITYLNEWNAFICILVERLVVQYHTADAVRHDGVGSEQELPVPPSVFFRVLEPDAFKPLPDGS